MSFLCCRHASNDTNMLLLPSDGPTPEDAAEDGSGKASAPVRLSKAQQRKQRRVQEEKAARERRAAVLADLAAHSLSAGQLAMLRPTALRGQVRRRVQQSGVPPLHERCKPARPSGGCYFLESQTRCLALCPASSSWSPRPRTRLHGSLPLNKAAAGVGRPAGAPSC